MRNENQPPFNSNYAYYQRAPLIPSNPSAFFAPPTSQLLPSIAPPAPDFEQNRYDNRMQSSQIASLKNSYESRIRELNQEIQLLKSSEQQKLLFLEAKCAKLNDVVVQKNSKLKAMENRLVSKILAHDREKNDLQAQCTKLNDDLLKKYFEMEALKENLQDELQQCNVKLAKAEGENLELKMINKRNSHKFELELNQMESEKKENAKSNAKLNETMAEIASDYTSFINKFSSQISKLKEKNKKLEMVNEMLRADQSDLDRCRRELGLEKTKKGQLQAELDSLEAELQESSQNLRKVEDENSELAQKLETAKSTTKNLLSELDIQTAELRNCRHWLKKADEECYKLNFQITDLEDALDQKEKEMLRLQKLSNKTKAALDTCQADLENALNDISRVVSERDLLKMELKSACANSWKLKANSYVA